VADFVFEQNSERGHGTVFFGAGGARAFSFQGVGRGPAEGGGEPFSGWAGGAGSFQFFGGGGGGGGGEMASNISRERGDFSGGLRGVGGVA